MRMARNEGEERTRTRRGPTWRLRTTGCKVEEGTISDVIKRSRFAHALYSTHETTAGRQKYKNKFS